MAKVSSVRNRSLAGQPPVEQEPVAHEAEPESEELYTAEEVVEEGPLTPWQRVWRFLSGPYPTLVSRLVLGGILLLAGLSKLGLPADMVKSINTYQMPIPSGVVQVMAWGVPIVEVIAGLMILVGLYTRIAAAVGGFLMLVFSIAITQAWLRGIEGDCGCFATITPNATNQTFGASMMKALGPIGTFLSDEKIGPWTVLRDLVFVLLAVHLILVPTIFAIDNWRRRRAELEMEEG